MSRLCVSFFAFGVFAVVLLGCSHAPTKVYESRPIETREKKFFLDSNTVLIDARPAFDVSISSPNGAIPLWHEDFCQKTPPFEGRLEADLYFHTRRLARLGINQSSKILVLGRGAQGSGEEGRMAFILKRLGIHEVRSASIYSLKWPQMQEHAPPRSEVSSWIPPQSSDLEISSAAALALLRNKREKVIWLDTRVPSAYLKDSSQDLARTKGLIVEPLNVPGSEFFGDQGEVRLAMREKLLGVGVSSDVKILVIDDLGVMSSAVVLALRELGFAGAQLWTGGYRELWGLRKSQSKAKR